MHDAVPFPDGDLRARKPWVCLMYHEVLPVTRATGGGAERFAVPVGAFECMLDAVLESGYIGCSLTTALEAVGRPRVAITFDDGTESQFDQAVPALRARGMTATFFVTTGWVGMPGFMTWDQLRTLVAWGMSVQSHTRSHPFLSELDAGSLRRELSEAKATLDRELGQDTREISLPGGNGPRRSLRSVLRETGHHIVAGSRWGLNADGGGGQRVWIRRCTLRGGVSPKMARRIVAGDPWLTRANYPREALLNAIRAAVGASRYARWRRRVLNSIDGLGGSR